MASVLVVAAHPDDELLGVGGTILRHRAAGDSVVVILMCCGDNLNNRAERIATAQGISAEYDLDTRFGQAPQLGYKVPSLRLIFLHPDIVYTHHPGDLNRDHRLVSDAVQVACRPYTEAVDVLSLRYFETPSSTEWGSGFAPNLFVDVAEHLVEKVDLVARYTTEARPYPHPRSSEALTERAQDWGSVSGYRAAEPFVIARQRW
jgi:LmbE family N-acetylglucosaminyl deacetylase